MDDGNFFKFFNLVLCINIKLSTVKEFGKKS